MTVDKRILIIGAGVSGIGAARLLLDAGACPVIYDGNTSLKEEALRDKLPESSDFRIFLGELPEKEKKETEVVVLSPGVPAELPLVEELRENGAEIWGEVELACKRKACGHYGNQRQDYHNGFGGRDSSELLSGSVCSGEYRKCLYGRSP